MHHPFISSVLTVTGLHLPHLLLAGGVCAVLLQALAPVQVGDVTSRSETGW